MAVRAAGVVEALAAFTATPPRRRACLPMFREWSRDTSAFAPPSEDDDNHSLTICSEVADLRPARAVATYGRPLSRLAEEV
jgi:hypothetical protein